LKAGLAGPTYEKISLGHGFHIEEERKDEILIEHIKRDSIQEERLFA